jgi:hypothetical protein
MRPLAYLWVAVGFAVLYGASTAQRPLARSDSEPSSFESGTVSPIRYKFYLRDLKSLKLDFDSPHCHDRPLLAEDYLAVASQMPNEVLAANHLPNRLK